MKVAACTILHLDYATADETMRRMARMGYQGIDMWGYSPHADPFVDRGDRQDLKNLAADLGLEMVALSVNGGPLARHLNFSHSTPWVREDTLDYYLRCIDLAAALGCRYINAISGVMMPGTSRQQAWEWLRECLIKVCKRAEEAGVTVALHTAPPNVSRVMTFADDALQLMEEIGSPACKVMFDTTSQHIAETNNTDTLRKMGEDLCYVHLADTMPDGTPGHEPIGSGTIHWTMLIKTLKEIGYDGWLTVQLDNNARAIDPDAWMYDSFNHLKRVLEGEDVWEA